MNKIAKYLNQHIVGNVYDRPEILSKYSTDHSILRVEPKMVVIPENTGDVRRIVRFVNQLHVKDAHLDLAIRGTGLDKTGADLSSGIVLSTEKLNHIQEIDEHARLVRVQSGVTLGQLNSALSLKGLTLPIAADPRQTIGSLIANFVSDDFGGKYNGIYYYVDCLEAVVSTGDVIQTSRLNRRFLEHKKGLSTFEGAIYREISNSIEDNFDVISDLDKKPTIDSAGYELIAQVYRERGRSFDLLPLFFASQGTLGVITEVILRCEVLPTDLRRFAVAFNSTAEVADFIKRAKTLDPREINFYDMRIFSTATENGKEMSLFSKKFNNGYLLLISFDDKARKAKRKVAKLLRLLPDSAAAIIENDDNTADFGRIETARRSYLNDSLNGERAPLTDDFYVPAEKMPEFLSALKLLEQTYDMDLPVMGSMSTGNYQVRPDIRFSTIDGRAFTLKFIKDLNQILIECEGSISGGSPEGRTKAIVTNPQLSDNEVELYQRIKNAFDPHHILGGEIKLDANPRATVKQVRTKYLNEIL